MDHRLKSLERMDSLERNQQEVKLKMDNLASKLAAMEEQLRARRRSRTVLLNSQTSSLAQGYSQPRTDVRSSPAPSRTTSHRSHSSTLTHHSSSQESSPRNTVCSYSPSSEFLIRSQKSSQSHSQTSSSSETRLQSRNPSTSSQSQTHTLSSQFTPQAFPSTIHSRQNATLPREEFSSSQVVSPTAQVLSQEVHSPAKISSSSRATYITDPGIRLLETTHSITKIELKSIEAVIKEPNPDDDSNHHEGTKPPEMDENGIHAGKAKDQLSTKLEEQGKVTDKTQGRRIQALAWKSDQAVMTTGPDVFVFPTGLYPLMYQSPSFLAGTGIGTFKLTTVSLKSGQAAPGVPNGKCSKELITSTTFSAIYGIHYTFMEMKDDDIQPPGRPPDNQEGAANVEADASSLSKPALFEETVVEAAQGLNEVWMKAVANIVTCVLVGGSLLVVDLMTADLETSDRMVLSTDIDSASMIPSLLRRDGERGRLCGVAKAIDLIGQVSCVDKNNASTELDIMHKLAINFWRVTGISESCLRGKWQVLTEARHAALASTTLFGFDGDDSTCKDLGIGHDSLLPSSGQLNELEKLSMMRNTTWILFNFCQDQPPTPVDLVRAVLPVCQQLIHMKEEVMMNVQEVELLAQKSRKYWEGRGAKMKLNSMPVYYSPP